MTKLSSIEVAEEILRREGKELAFNDLWGMVVEQLQLTEAQATNKIAKFYSDLSLTPKFVGLDNNHWDLRERRTLNDVIIDTSDILLEEDDDDLEIIEYDSNFGNDEF